jgi:hypothetical protein
MKPLRDQLKASLRGSSSRASTEQMHQRHSARRPPTGRTTQRRIQGQWTIKTRIKTKTKRKKNTTKKRKEKKEKEAKEEPKKEAELAGAKK